MIRMYVYVYMYTHASVSSGSFGDSDHTNSKPLTDSAGARSGSQHCQGDGPACHGRRRQERERYGK